MKIFFGKRKKRLNSIQNLQDHLHLRNRQRDEKNSNKREKNPNPKNPLRRLKKRMTVDRNILQNIEARDHSSSNKKIFGNSIKT